MAQLASTGSLNRDTLRMVDALIADAASLRLVVQRLDNGVLVVDAGIACQGSLEAGRRIAEICMGGQGHVALQAAGTVSGWSTNITVHSNNPVIACLGSQYAGWSLSHGEGKQAFHALGSGPGRIAGCATFVLEVDKLPPFALTEKIASDCGVAPEQLRLILTPTCSLAGSTQVVARVLEVALHKAHELGFSLIDIVDGMATAPLPPPAPDFLQAMGRTNDAILFAGQVHLFVSGDDSAAEALADSLPSSSSKDYGRPFAEVFKAYEYDFFKIDPMLFSPARTLVSNINTGRSFTSGQIDQQLLLDSFGVTL